MYKALKSSRVYNSKKRLFSSTVLALSLLITACSKQVELNSGLLERDANAVIGALAENNISAEKIPRKDGVSIVIDSSNMGKALRVLRVAGLPKAPHDTLGTMFPDDGVISTPLEEQARYIYALSQELEYTLSEIDGVVIARVHVVLPEKVAPGEPVMPASASVFIKHQDSLDPDVINTRIHRLVAGSIPGLIENKNKLSVVFVPVKKPPPTIEMQKFGPFWLDAENDYLRNVVKVMAAVLISFLLATLLYVMRKKGIIFSNQKMAFSEFKFPSKKNRTDT